VKNSPIIIKCLIISNMSMGNQNMLLPKCMALPISVIWMSYNVHGNEANSTETSMKVLHELVGSGKEEYREVAQKPRDHHGSLPEP
jgi:hypothetical protein